MMSLRFMPFAVRTVTVPVTAGSIMKFSPSRSPSKFRTISRMSPFSKVNVRGTPVSTGVVRDLAAGARKVWLFPSTSLTRSRSGDVPVRSDASAAVIAGALAAALGNTVATAFVSDFGVVDAHALRIDIAKAQADTARTLPPSRNALEVFGLLRFIGLV